MKIEGEKSGIKIFTVDDWADYELLDTGEGEKFERFGKYKFVRPYEDAVWGKSLNKDEWEKSEGKFQSSKSGGKGALASLKQRESGWRMKDKIDQKWEMSYSGMKFFVSPTPFRHLGFFPEQAYQWKFIEEKIKASKNPIKFLNLFGYTGVASLFALRGGAEVTHVDASKQTLNWAKENQKLSGLDSFPMRIIEDDILKFLEREAKRGNKYDAIVMDPPKFGRGPKGEIWNIEEKLSQLLSLVQKVLSNNPLFVILTSYATDSSSLSLGNALSDMMKSHRGEIEQGELCLIEKSNERLISLANTAIWTSK